MNDTIHLYFGEDKPKKLNIEYWRKAVKLSEVGKERQESYALA